MKCGMNETNATVKISPLSIKQFRHARTIPILSSIYFRPYTRIYTYIYTLCIFPSYRVSLAFVQASPIFPSFLRSVEILEICNIHVSKRERERERQQRNIASLVSILPHFVFLFSFDSSSPYERTYVSVKEKKRKSRRKKKLHRVNSEPGVIRSLN